MHRVFSRNFAAHQEIATENSDSYPVSTDLKKRPTNILNGKICEGTKILMFVLTHLCSEIIVTWNMQGLLFINVNR